MKTPTVYTTVAHDGTIRMALHPMDSAPKQAYFGRGKIKFPFRVAFSKSYGHGVYSRWARSCRGKCYHNVAGEPINSGTDYQAIQWLLKGEKL